MDDSTHEQSALSRRRFLLVAGGTAAAATGLVALPSCGEDEVGAGERVASPNVDAPQLRNYPYIPAQAPLNCTIYGFFSADESRTVDAFVARLIPGNVDDPGASEACVPHYIDRKLAEYETFATPTYEGGPFAKPAHGRAIGFEGDTVYVDEHELPRYGFQSSLTPQEAYRKGIAQLDMLARTLFGSPFADLASARQDDVLTGLAANDPSEKGRKKLARASARVKRLAAAAKDAFKDPSAFGFFAMLQGDCNEGMFADPLYGGNRDFAGWKLIDYPGIQRAWTPEELKQGPMQRTIKALRDLHAQHPGRPEDHVILPIAGTRRATG